MTTWLGGPIGYYARLSASRWSPLAVVILVTTAMFVIGVIQKAPCHIEGWPRETGYAFSRLCYSDVAYLYRERGFAQGSIAYLDSGNYPALEYPVLTGLVMQITAWVTQAFGNGAAVAESVLFFDLTVVVLFLFALLAVWSLSRIAPHRPYDAMFFAAAPTLALAGTINWDLVAVALTACALLTWSRSRPFATGVLIGLGAAAKFYPLLLLGPLLVLALRSGKLRLWGVTMLSASAAWLAVNLPLIVLAQDSWKVFWSFNTGRDGDFGSIWYVLKLAEHPVPGVNAVSLGLFALACLGIASLAILAPRRPRLASLVFLTVAAFLLVNKVYSPQYVLWLLPFVALARPRWRDWAVWQVGELIYWVAIWLHLAGILAPANDAPDRLYWAAVGIRIAATLYLCAVVVRDILVPSADVVRERGLVDDPTGGPFDQAADARWCRRLLGARRPGRPPLQEGVTP
ncbi:glycosyltransferase family 87 protein [Actinopolymorpha alba]|uniref:glycosyltransferase family 87 protein n=1 Tax=Actinopolymorpha alba TaxID=533267 RepID=UPI00037E2125|nr:glycosyltransferase 87 family protein [Actinopolymorpha alba]